MRRRAVIALKHCTFKRRLIALAPPFMAPIQMETDRVKS